MQTESKRHDTRPRFILMVLFVFLMLSAVPAFAWNDEGHMAVAYLAYQRLNPAVRERVNLLLQRHPEYSKWLAMLPAGTSKFDAQRMVFMIAATWPDQIKGSAAYKDDGPYGGNVPEGPESTQNIGYADHLRHRYWHFIDLFFSQDGTPLPKLAVPNVQTQIAAFRALLHSDASDDLKSYDLVWLEHLVGDVHQPLHAATRVSKDLPEGDAGGNLVLLCRTPCNNTLHSLWDRLVGSQSPQVDPDGSIDLPKPPQYDLAAELRSAIVAAKMIAAKAPSVIDIQRADSLSEASWVQESFQLAKHRVYASPIGSGGGPFTITPQYLSAAKAVAVEQVAVAGARLANLLNSELK